MRRTKLSQENGLFFALLLLSLLLFKGAARLPAATEHTCRNGWHGSAEGPDLPPDSATQGVTDRYEAGILTDLVMESSSASPGGSKPDLRILCLPGTEILMEARAPGIEHPLHPKGIISETEVITSVWSARIFRGEEAALT